MLSKTSFLIFALIFGFTTSQTVFAQKTKPVVDSPTFANVTTTTATLGGTITSDGGKSISARGVEWGTTSGTYPTPLTEGGTAVGTFTQPVTGLPSGTTIYFRAWATNQLGTGYSAESSFTTDPAAAVAPTVDTPTFADVTETTATLGGTVSSDGSATITERGTVWGLATDPDIVAQAANVNTVAGTTGPFTGPVSGLPSGTLIHFRAYATNSEGTSYSADTTFTTLTPAVAPTVDTPTFADVTDTTATLGGNVSSDGGSAITERGTVWGLAADPDIVAQAANVNTVAGTTGIFSGPVSGLPSGTLIHFRAYATNSAGTSYTADTTFTTTTPAVAPTVDTPTFADVTDTTATLGGNVSSDGGATITERGTVWGLAADPDIVAQAANVNTVVGTTGTFTGPVSGLPSGTLIHFRAYATNSAGTSYTADTTFTTTIPASLPTVDTPTFAGVTATTAALGGNVSSDGGGAITERGTVWGLAADPDIVAQAANVNTVAGTTGIFSGPVSGLPAGTLIHFRAYATNSAGTSYTADTTFTTLVTLPTVDSPTFAAVTDTSATLGGTVSSDGGAAITERGTVWGLATDPDIVAQAANVNIVAGTTGTFTGPVSGLPTATLVYYRAYATNSEGTAYSASGSFTLTTTTTPPELDTPTATSINYFSAVLGGTITSDGGEAITARGTVWNLTGPPIVEHKLNDGGTATGTFSHTRISLPKDTTIWYRAYATNAEGTGYTADASFVTAAEPDVQVSNITFPQIGANSMRINWTKGNGEGNIVVLRLATTGKTDPADGSDYTGNGDFALATELPTNSQNFVIYNGTHNAIQVHGLSQLTNYTVAIYTYAGSGASINYLNPPAEASQATTDVPVHNMDYAPDCSHCHNHGGFDFVPRDVNQQSVCETCHNETGPASAKLDFALHLTPGYAANDVDCGSCHELHNPNGATTATHTLDPFTTTTNKSFIRSDVDKYVSTAAAGNVALYQTPITDLAVEDGNATTARGICQSCHTQVGNHRHDGTGDQCHDGGGGNCDAITNGGVDCLGCHTHVDSFAASGGGCTGCHSSTQGGAPPLDRREIVSEFSRLTHHVGGPLADSDCEVCHQQTAADAPTHTHKDGSLTLWNVDSHGTAGDYQLTDHSDPNTDVGEAATLIPFCLNCHDSDGALAEASPSAPFTGSGAPADIASTWSTSSHATVSQPVSGGSGQPTTCLGDGSFGCHGTGHGSEKLKLLTPADTIAISPEFTEEEEGFCFNCHDADGPSQFDIESQFNSGTNYTAYSTAVSKNPPGEHNQRHDILYEDQNTFGSAIECTSCHRPHKDNSEDANIGVVSNPDSGAKLADYNPANHTAGELPVFDPTNPIGCNPANGTPHVGCETVPGRIEPDYIEFCTACHDGGPTYPSGVVMKPLILNMATAYETDQHGKGQQDQEGKGTLKPPWVTTIGDDYLGGYASLNCTTCHGPHGSVNIYNLRESITVAGVQMEIGGTPGSGFDDFSGTTYTLPGVPQEDHKWGAWCTFCHNLSGHSSYNEGTTCTDGHKHGDSNF